MMYWILCVVIFAGVTSTSAKHVKNDIQPRSSELLERFPSVVQVEYYNFWSTMQWSKKCSANILTTRFMLSTATCFSGWDYEARFRRFRAGSNIRESGGAIVYVANRLNHLLWNQYGYTADLSVVRTMTPLAFNALTQQAGLAPPGSWIPNNLRLSQPGWGSAGQQSLSHHEVLTADRSNCERRDGEFSERLNATVNILCVIPPSVAVPNFDVGSPWIFSGITVGIASGVNANGEYRGLIGADVAQFTDWIIYTVENFW